MKIVLIGYRCTGKTTVGKRLAELLGLPFYDTDEIVQSKAGKSIREMVDQEGWEAFRKQERAIIKTLPAAAGAVIAAGGGAIMDVENRKALKEHGLCVWLTADIRTILKRMRNDRTSDTQRPPLSDNDMEQETAKILAARRSLYREMADCTVDTSGKGIEAVVDEIRSCLRLGSSDRKRSRAT